MKKILLLAAALLSMPVLHATNDGTVIMASTPIDGFHTTLGTNNIMDQPPHVEFKNYGFYGIVDFSYFTNFNDNAEMSNLAIKDKFSLMGLTAIAGFQWRHASAAGIGFSYLKDQTGSFSQIPVFVEYRCHFLRNRVTPYAAAQLGWSIPLHTVNSGDNWIKINKGGITFGIEAGARLAIRPRFGMNLFVGYQLLNLRAVERSAANMKPSYWHYSMDPETGLPVPDEDLSRAAQNMPELYHCLKAGIGFCF